MRYFLVQIAVALAMLAGMLLSWRLWLNERTYPLVPVWDGLPTIAPPWDRIVPVAMIFVLGLSVGLSRPRWGLLGFVLLTGLWCLCDQTRWQPWVYHYLVMLAALGLADSPNPERREAGLSACRLVLAATYIWSGIQKVNVSFATDVYPWMMDPVLDWFPKWLGDWVSEQGWYAAFVECGLGLGLLFRPTRLVAVIGLLGMHATILYCLSPWGHNWNSVVWPWNVAMMTLLVLLFVWTRDVSPWRILWPRQFWFGRLVLVLFVVMPLFSFWGAWDAYLSACLYSGNTLEAQVEVSDEIAAKLPGEVRYQYLSGRRVSLFHWAIGELNVPAYPARRVYRDIARQLDALGDKRDGATLTIKEQPDWLTGKRELTRESLWE